MGEAIIESVIRHSLNGQQEQIVDRTQLTFLDVEENHNSIGMVEEELTELDRDMTRLILDLQAMEERLRTRPLLQRRQRRTLEGRRRQRVEAGLERSRQRRLHRARDVIAAGLILGELSEKRPRFLEADQGEGKNFHERGRGQDTQANQAGGEVRSEGGQGGEGPRHHWSDGHTWIQPFPNQSFHHLCSSPCWTKT